MKRLLLRWLLPTTDDIRALLVEREPHLTVTDARWAAGKQNASVEFVLPEERLAAAIRNGKATR